MGIFAVKDLIVYSMNKKLLSVLQAKCKDFGLSEKAIEDLATTASEGLNDESSDEDIEKVADSLVPYAKLMQAEATRAVAAPTALQWASASCFELAAEPVRELRERIDRLAERRNPERWEAERKRRHGKMRTERAFEQDASPSEAKSTPNSAESTACRAINRSSRGSTRSASLC